MTLHFMSGSLVFVRDGHDWKFLVRDRRRGGPYQSCRPVCSIALMQAKLKEFFDRVGATNCLFEIRLGYLRSLWSSHCEWLISASRSILIKERDSPVRFDTGQSTSTVNCNVR